MDELDTAIDASVLTSVKAAIVTVGLGRGFIVEARRRVPAIPGINTVPFITNRFVMTAAHCLPQMPPAHPASFDDDRTFVGLVGPLDGDQRIAAECLFVDPIADVAVLCAPNGQSPLFYDDWEAWEDFIEGCSAVRLGVLTATSAAWLLTRDRQWDQCSVRLNKHGATTTLVLVGATQGNAPGCSGSPIVTSDGCAVGVVSVGSLSDGKPSTEQYGQPRLASVLPAWLLSELNEKGEA